MTAQPQHSVGPEWRITQDGGGNCLWRGQQDILHTLQALSGEHKADILLRLNSFGLLLAACKASYDSENTEFRVWKQVKEAIAVAEATP